MKYFKKTAVCVLSFICALSFLFLVSCAVSDGKTDLPTDEITRPDDTQQPPPTTGDAQITVAELGKPKYELLLGDESLESLMLDVSAYGEWKNAEKSEIVFSTDDPSVAEVDASGKLTAKSHGKTVFSATYRDEKITSDIFVYGSADKEQVNSFDEKYIHRFGRQYVTAKGLNVDHVASGVEATFYGTWFSARILTTRAVCATVFVDGGEGVFTRLASGWSTNKFASDLPEGVHTVRILKSSEIDDGSIVFSSFDADRFLLPQEKPDFKIEFIGDSVTTGYGALGKTGEYRTVENSDACSSYAFLTAQTLGADFSFVALQGIGITRKQSETYGNMMQMYTYVSPHNKEPYVSENDPDVIVVNLGGNDGYSGAFSDDYKNLLSVIRNINENSHIVCITGGMFGGASVEEAIKHAIEATGDGNISYFGIPVYDYSGASSHTGKAAHAKMAE